MTDMLKAALDLLALGFSVFPLKPCEKIPHWDLLPQKVDDLGQLVWVDDKENETLTNTGRPKHTWLPFAEEKPTIEQVKAWWTKSPRANIGIATGPVSGCFVLDVDGAAGVQHLQRHEKLPKTPVSRSGKDDGYHCYFQYPPFKIKNATEFLTDLDIRGYHGYIVAPPSIHPNMKPYRWAASPFTTPIAQAPDWLLEVLKPAPERPHKPYPMDNPVEDEELARRALDALQLWRLDDYDMWIKIGASLRPLGSNGLTLWDNWSARSSKHHERDCTKRWGGLRGTSPAVLFRLANQDAGNLWQPLKPTPSVARKLELADEEPDEESTRVVGPTSLSIELRSALNAYAPAGVGATLELWLEGIGAGLIQDGDPVSVKCLEYVNEKLGRGVSRTTLTKALNQGVVQFCEKLPLYKTLDQVDARSTNGEGVLGKPPQISQNCTDCGSEGDPCNPLNAGRKATLYALLPMSEIIDKLLDVAYTPILKKHFPATGALVAPVRSDFLEGLGVESAADLADDLDEQYREVIESQAGYQRVLGRAQREYRRLMYSLRHPTCAPIPAGRAYGGAGQYVAECARALVAADPDGVLQLWNWQLAFRIGCSVRSLPSVLERAGVITVGGQKVVGEAKSKETVDKAIHRAYDREHDGYPQAFKTSESKRVYFLTRPGCLDWARKAQADGAVISIVYLRPNKQFIPAWTLKAWALAQVKRAIDDFLATAPVVQQDMFAEPKVVVVDEMPEIEPEPAEQPEVPPYVPSAYPWSMKYPLVLQVMALLGNWLALRQRRRNPLNYQQTWFNRLTVLAVDKMKTDFKPGLIKPGDPNPASVNETLEFLTTGVVPVTVAPPCPDPEVVTGWQKLQEQFNQLMQGAQALLLPPPASWSPTP
jgi:hypothetical protein